MTELQPDEEAFLALGGRCETCGHLRALHNGHCCEFCLVCEEIDHGKLRDDFTLPDSQDGVCREGPGF